VLPTITPTPVGNMVRPSRLQLSLCQDLQAYFGLICCGTVVALCKTIPPLRMYSQLPHLQLSLCQDLLAYLFLVCGAKGLLQVLAMLYST
jgi:hypothetical protein